ncbi:NAD(P)H-dependent flavin oxidoreductase [Advenella mimigardefordensis]|uniref:Nitronate monooxygenase n=1 Tax=Advenella mimigardefordensis (strain DSM 17166 / LMG 22922 / DPN7) TaxID=1247726 RepID=W0PG82_ADVMD|nr:nitronate monooxygenase [Advenella mimigardefordensis]AHG64562.1 putative nitronate monooxygenase [Advenella mimigardefordensis DPN7]
MTHSHSFTARLDIQPIIQAPMAGVSTPQLAAAVSSAGGLGSLGIGASTATQAALMIDETRALTSRPFNVNVFCHAPAARNVQREDAWLRHLAPLFAGVDAQTPIALDEIYKSFIDGTEVFELLLQKRPAVVSFHFGLPSMEQINALRAAGIFTLATATSLAEAASIEASGIDAIIAQGVEAGGHRGVFNPDGPDEQLGTTALLSLLLKHTKLPVIAAGGIMDGRGIQAALAAGAAAAQLGTAFVLCPESSANTAYRSALKSEAAATTRLTSAFSGRPARGIANSFITHCEKSGSPRPAAYPVAYDAAKQLNTVAAKQGNNSFAAHWAGTGAPLARALPAAQLLATLIEEMQQAQQTVKHQ